MWSTYLCPSLRDPASIYVSRPLGACFNLCTEFYVFSLTSLVEVQSENYKGEFSDFKN